MSTFTTNISNENSQSKQQTFNQKPTIKPKTKAKDALKNLNTVYIAWQKLMILFYVLNLNHLILLLLVVTLLFFVATLAILELASRGM